MLSFAQLGRWGRLGNQLFEYAALLGAGHRLGVDVAIPPLGHHQLGELVEVPTRILTRRDRRRIRRRFVSRSIAFDPRWSELRDGTDLRGFFQSTRYFPPRPVLEAALRLRADVVVEADAVWRTAVPDDRPVVGITVRRGDYRLFADQFVQVWDTDFYDRAFDLVADLHPFLIVSSDDPDWCRARFGDRDGIVVDRTVRDAAQFALLLRCDHLVVANSTYAWWAAWLSPTAGMRITPRQWWQVDARWPERERERPPPDWIELDAAPLPSGRPAGR